MSATKEFMLSQFFSIFHFSELVRMATTFVCSDIDSPAFQMFIFIADNLLHEAEQP